MNEAEVTALREWIADRETYHYPAVGDVEVQKTPEGVVINRFDQTIGVTLELAKDVLNDLLAFAVETDENDKPIGVLTISAANRTLRYSVLSLCLPWDTLVCTLIEPFPAS